MLLTQARQGAARQHGRPEIHAGRLGAEELPRLNRRQGGRHGSGSEGASARWSPAAARASAAAAPTSSPTRARTSRSAPATQAEVDATVAALRAKGVTRARQGGRRRRQGGARGLGRRGGRGAWAASTSSSPTVSALDMGDTEEAWRHEFEIDLMHTVRTVNAAMPWLEKSEAPAIVVDLQRLRARDRLHQPGLRRHQGRPDPLRPGPRLQARRQDDPGELGLARQHLLRRRHLAVDRDRQSRSCSSRPSR